MRCKSNSLHLSIDNMRLPIYILLILISAQILFAANPRCYQCNLKIQQTYIEYNDNVYHPACYEATADRCAVCNVILSGSVIAIEGKQYHKSCYEDSVAEHCGVCEKPILSAIIEYEGGHYHEECYINSVLPRCAVCDEPLREEYRVDYWGNNTHKRHEDEYSPCESCGRLISDRLTGGGVTIDDDRRICGICFSTAIFDDVETKVLAKKVSYDLAYYGIKIDMNDIPVILTDPQELARLTGRIGESNELGLAKSEKITRAGNVINRSDSVYAIYGLPERVLEGVLAHEMMHVWMAHNAKEKPSQAVVEGVSNYASFLIYNSRNDSMARMLIDNLQADPDSIYGDGYRQVSKFVEQSGLKELLDGLKHGTLDLK